jgi:hypothetical protein
MNNLHASFPTAANGEARRFERVQADGDSCMRLPDG